MYYIVIHYLCLAQVPPESKESKERDAERTLNVVTKAGISWKGLETTKESLLSNGRPASKRAITIQAVNYQGISPSLFSRLFPQLGSQHHLVSPFFEGIWLRKLFATKS